MYDAFLHAECGLDNRERAAYTRQELDRLMLGWLLREEPGRELEDGASAGGAREQRRRIRQGQQEQREEMFRDLGIQ